MSVSLRQAVIDDLDQLTAIAFAAKAHWGYPKEWLEQWHEELTMTPAHLDNLQFAIAEVEGNPAGFCALGFEGSVCAIHHMWVMPEFMGHGIGRRLFDWVVNIAFESGAQTLDVLSDPYAEPFYEKMGLVRTQLESSSIPDRFLPRMHAPLANYRHAVSS